MTKKAQKALSVAAAAHKLPEKLFVRRDDQDCDPGDSYFVTEEDEEAIDDGNIVGVYQLVSIAEVKVTTTRTIKAVK